MGTKDRRRDTKRPSDRSSPPEPSSGQSVERERQDKAITRAAARESWVEQLLRSLRLSKGRPKPGQDKSSGPR
jgi:hypothetical protein